jgi:replicative DNA helicase
MDQEGQVLEPGNLVIVAGRPSAGKTTFEGQISRHVALVEGRSVFRVTRDTTQAGLVRRDLTAMTPGMTLHRAKSMGLGPEHFARLREAAAELGGGKIWIDDRARYLEDMLIQCRMMKARHDISIVTVDYAQLIEVANLGGRAQDDERRIISKVTGAFKALAIELGIPVLLLAQLSRSAEMEADKPPQMKDLKGSGSIEQDAEVILFLYRSVKFQYGVPYYSPARNADGSPIVDLIGGRQVTRMDKASEAILMPTDPRRPITLTKAKHKDGALGEWPLWLDAGFFMFSPAWEFHGQAHLNQSKG